MPHVGRLNIDLRYSSAHALTELDDSPFIISTPPKPTMLDLSHLASLKQQLRALEVLTPDSPAFHEHTIRWSDIDRKTPGAIIFLTSEYEVQTIVRWAVSASIPFVPTTSRHSPWSTIGSDGVVVDLRQWKEINVDEQAQTVTVKGGVLAAELAAKLDEKGLFTALGWGADLGVIPYCIGGGRPLLHSVTGFGSDQILSARIVVASGEVVDVDKRRNADLLYAVRGAGQFFGIVTEFELRCYELRILGNERGLLWEGTWVFSLERVKEVTSVMRRDIVDYDEYDTCGVIMVMNLPPTMQPGLVVSARYVGDARDAPKAFKSLEDLGPLFHQGKEISYKEAVNGLAANNAKRGYKLFSIKPLRDFRESGFADIVSIWREMMDKCSSAQRTGFAFQWDSRPVPDPGFESAMCLHDHRYGM